MDARDYIGTSEVARLLRISESTALKWAACGKLPARRRPDNGRDDGRVEPRLRAVAGAGPLGRVARLRFGSCGVRGDQRPGSNTMLPFRVSNNHHLQSDMSPTFNVQSVEWSGRPDGANDHHLQR